VADTKYLTPRWRLSKRNTIWRKNRIQKCRRSEQLCITSKKSKKEVDEVTRGGVLQNTFKIHANFSIIREMVV
jgi:hypothetical protein